MLGLGAPLPAAATTASGNAQMQGAHVVSWGSVAVSASAELAFEVLTDYERMVEFLPGMLASAVVSRTGNTVVIEQSADQGIFLFRHRIDARLAIVESPPRQLSIRALAGSFKELDGSYLLTRKKDHTLIEYRGRFLPDFHLPPMIGTYAVQRSLERHLDALADEIERRQAEETAREAQAAQAAQAPQAQEAQEAQEAQARAEGRGAPGTAGPSGASEVSGHRHRATNSGPDTAQ